jgi:hypothetical protein
VSAIQTRRVSADVFVTVAGSATGWPLTVTPSSRPDQCWSPMSFGATTLTFIRGVASTAS